MKCAFFARENFYLKRKMQFIKWILKGESHICADMLAALMYVFLCNKDLGQVWIYMHVDMFRYSCAGTSVADMTESFINKVNNSWNYNISIFE